MKGQATFLLAAILATGAAPRPTAALPAPQAQAAVISGTVVDPVGRPVAGARIAIAELGRAVLTDAQGRFSLGDVPRGRFTLLVSRTGFGAVSRTLQPGDDAGTITLASAEQHLPPVSVTAARTPIRPEQSPLPGSELRDEDLRSRTNVSIARAIDQLPGVRAVTTGDQIAKPMIRGLSGSRVLVLDNGMRLEDYSWSDEDGPSVEARLADRVEVIRGPASLMYGSDAIGGVVNAVPAALPTAAGGRAFRRLGAEAWAGSNNMEVGGGLRAEGASGKWGWRAVGIGRFAEDLHTPAGKVDNTGFVAANGEGAVAYHSTRGTSTLRYSRYGGEYKLLEAEKPAGSAEEEGGPERVLGDDRLQFAGNYVVGQSRLETRLQYQRHNLIEKSDDLVPFGGPKDAEVFNLLLSSFTADVLLHRALGDKLQGTAGVTAMYQGSDSRGPLAIIPDGTVSSAGAFAIGRYALPRVTLLAGVRGEGRHLDAKANGSLDREATTRNHSAISADVGTVVDLGGGLALTGNAGRAWRAPTLFELFSNGPRLGEARYEIGDPTINPERSLNLDAGLRYRAGRAQLEGSVYRNRIDDYIYIRPTGATASSLPVYRYGSADARLDGAEIAAEVRAVDALTLRARHDFVHGTNRADDSPLPLMAPARTDVEAEVHPARVGRLQAPSLGVEVEMNARQDRLAAYDLATRPYTLVNLEAGFGGHLAAHEVRVGISVRNLLDAEYRSFLSRYKAFALDPGRNIMVRVSTGL